MTTERLTLLGDIPGLLRESSRVRSRLVPGCVGLVLRVRDNGTADVCWYGKADGTGDEVEHGVPLCELALDLSDPTGRAHAAWWLDSKGVTQSHCLAIGERWLDLEEILSQSCSGGEMPRACVDILRRLVLAVAGLEVPA